MIALNYAVGNQFTDILTIYIDDFLIAITGSVHDHFLGIQSIFNVLQEKNFTFKLEKSIFCQSKINFLGYELSIDAVRPIPERLDFIRNFPRSENRLQLQQFLEVCTYYRQFTLSHSNLLDLFRNLLKANNPWN